MHYQFIKLNDIIHLIKEMFKYEKIKEKNEKKEIFKKVYLIKE